MQSVHHLHPRLMGSTRPLRVLLVGAGGSGSAVLLQLPFMEQALRAWGQPGLAVTVMDPDTVSEVNVVRQPFSRFDIGSNKAMCLVGRINMFWGFAWKAIPRYFGDSPAGAPECDLLISCVEPQRNGHQKAWHAARARPRDLISPNNQKVATRHWHHGTHGGGLCKWED